MSVLESGRRGPRPRAGKRRPARRTYKPAAERQSQILDCALAAFAEHGYHATSIADVCERAGIGRATLYQYFKDKRDLLVALAERIATRVVAAAAQRGPMRVPAGFRPTEEQAVLYVQKRFTDILKAVFEDADTARLVIRSGRGADGVVDDILKRIDDAVLDRMETELRTAREAGVIRPLDERFVARFFLGGIEKIVIMALDEDRPFDIEAIAREAALLEMIGILPEEKR